MKQFCLLVLLLVLGSTDSISAQAESGPVLCLTVEEARVSVRQRLILQGRREFPRAFFGKSESEQLVLIDTAARGVMEWVKPSHSEDIVIGYWTLVYRRMKGPVLEAEEYLAVSCDGKFSKIVEGRR